MKLHWKEPFLSNRHQLFEQEEEVGFLKHAFFNNSTKSELKNAQFEFKSRGILSNTVDILDSNQEVIGSLTYHGLRTEAKIELGDTDYLWKFDNVWSSKWSINKDEKTLIKYQSKWFKGELESEINSDVLLLAGLYIYHHYVQIFVVLAVVVIMISSS